MIIPDINLLVYAYNSDAPHHDDACCWWENLINEEISVSIPWVVICGFLRLVTHSSVVEIPMTAEAALDRVHTWLEQPRVRIVDPGHRHLEILGSLFKATGIAASLTTDAHIAAIAIEHNATVHSNDQDFARFPGLKWENPLVV